MVSRRLRLVIVAVFLAFTIVLLTHKQVDTSWIQRVGDKQANDDGSANALKAAAGSKDKSTADESDAADDADADADADAVTSSEIDTSTDYETATDSLVETATVPPTSVVTEDPAAETTSSEESVPTEVVDHDYPPKEPEPLPNENNVDWNKFAYSQYVTDIHYLCNSVMIFETLYSLGSRAKRVMMYPKHMLKNPKAKKGKKPEEQLLIKARDKYGVDLMPIEIQHRDSADSTWADSYTKLLAFNLTQYKRVIALDSDSVVLQAMDELFLLPSAPVAMPRAYWLFDEEPPKKILSSQLILLQPSTFEGARIMGKMEEAGKEDYDMEIVNQLYLDSAMVLPHRPYNLITSEFRNKDHTRYLGSEEEEWNPVDAFNEAKFLHFSDWPVPKPWIGMSDKLRIQMQPDCPKGKKRCPARDLWNGFYYEFATRRKRVCPGIPELEAAELASA